MLPATFYSLDTPAGPLLLAPCLHPDSDAEHPDIPLSRSCELHGRTWYWCLDRAEAWCDGGPRTDYTWHVGHLEAEPADDESQFDDLPFCSHPADDSP
jgi:hypothetical protein